jgi:hypothetical protein
MIIMIQDGTISFQNQSEKTVTFSQSFGKIPIVIANPISVHSDLNVYIEDVTISSFKISTSQNYTGNLNYQAFERE